MKTKKENKKVREPMSKKKKKIILLSVAAVLLVVILATSLSLYFVYRSKGPFEGTVTDMETGLPIADVMVSDGRNVTKTDDDGKFNLDGYYNSTFVTVTIPSGYNAEAFYIPVSKDTKSYDFKLKKLDKDYSGGHSFLQISDTEIGTDSNVDGWMNHVKSLVNELQPDFLIHTGDICYVAGLERHIEVLNEETLGIPVRWVIGNHDYVKWGKYGEALYESLYGPVWYSFDVGNVHYVVTPFQNGGDVKSGYNKNDRWKWLENDLKNVDPDMEVVMFNHTTPPSDDYVISYGTQKLDLKKHNLKAWIYGHYHDNVVENDGGILKISTARPDCGGIDSSVSGTRHIKVSADGAMETQMYYYDFDGAETSPEETAADNLVWKKEDLKGNVLFADTLYDGSGTVYVATSDDDYPRECGVYAVDAETGVQKWFFKTENSVKNNLVLVGNTVVAQDACGLVYGLKADTANPEGERIWRTQVGIGNAVSTSSGIVTDGEKVYVGCAAEVSALNASDGNVVWRNPRNRGESSPSEFLLAGDKLLVGSHWDALVALNKSNGKQIWANDDGTIRFRSSTPALNDDNTAIVADSDAVMVVDLAKGKIKTKTKFTEEIDGKTVSIYNFNTSSKPFVKDGVAYIATSNKGVIAYKIETEKVLWNFMTGKSMVYTAPYTSGNAATVESSFFEYDGSIVFGASDGCVYRVNAEDGSLMKKFEIGAPILGTPARVGDGFVVSDFAGRMFKLKF